MQVLAVLGTVLAAAVLLAAICYAFSSVFARRNAKGVELDASATELSLDDAGCEPLRVRLPTSVDVARIGATEA